MDTLVTDANQRVALEIIRSLGRKGLDVGAVERECVNYPLSFISRYADQCFKVPDYASDRFLEVLEQSETLFPVSTNTHLELYGSWDSIKSKSLIPIEETFRTVNDKGTIREICEDMNILVPDTTSLEPEDDPEEVLRDRSIPVVMKLEDDEGLYLPPGDRYEIVRSSRNLTTAFERLSEYGKTILVQDYIDGDGYGFSGLYDRSSNFCAGGGHHRLRELPPEGGPSSFCESVSVGAIKEKATKLLQSLDWVGPAMVEFRRSARTGKFYLLEINPRYWGSLPLLRTSGLNLPYLQYRLITEPNNIEASGFADPGERIQFIPHDLLSLWQSWSSGKISSLKFLAKSKDVFNPLVHSGLFEGRDPWPFIRFVTQRLFSEDAER